MCGIAGIINLDDSPVSPDILKAMNSSLKHRGPDDGGYYLNSNIGLAHRRLSIIDLKSGRQPLCNENGEVWTVFNGEIYNFQALRYSLQEKGHVFKTESDTETIVHLYEEYGLEFTQKLDGMFALALYDKRRNIVILARDRAGKKPLFYFITDKHMVFASELQALRKHPAMPSDYDTQAIHDYFSLQYIPAPSTVFKGVFKLPPAHWLKMNISEKKHNIKRYWNISYLRKTGMSFNDAAAKLRELMEESIKARLVSDVPLGAFLSGGMDSTIVAGLMSKLSNDKVKTFTIGFDNPAYDERDYAQKAISFINENSSNSILNFEKTVEPDDINVIYKLVRHYGEPYCDSSMLPTYFLSKFTREHVTVALSGDGADELFAGYDRYRAIKTAELLDCVPAALRENSLNGLLDILPNSTEQKSILGKFRRIIKTFAANPQKRYFGVMSKFEESEKLEIEGERLRAVAALPTDRIFEELANLTTTLTPTEIAMETDFHSYLPGDILTKVDIASMANSLEVRCPFLDTKIMEFAASLPLEYKLSGSSGKHILKTAFADILHPDIINRRKMGFGVPVAAWFRGTWEKTLREHLLEGPSVKNGFLNKTSIEKMIDSHIKLQADYSYQLWSMLIFDIFLQDSTQE